MRIWTVANQKGGVGKTTTAVTLGGLLADRGARVLLLDLDPHGSLTSYFRLDPDRIEGSTFDLFAGDSLEREALRNLLRPIAGGELSLLPSSSPLATVERRASGKDGMGLRISRALAQLWDDFDYTIIDTPPVLGTLMINSLAAAERLLIPVQTEFLAIRGLERMLRTLSMVGRSLHKSLPHLIVPTLFDRRTQASISSLRQLRNSWPDEIWAGMVPVDTRFRDASRAGELPSHFAPEGRGVQAYSALLKVLLREQEQRLRA